MTVPATQSTQWDCWFETVIGTKMAARLKFREGQCWGLTDFDQWLRMEKFDASSPDEMEALIVADVKWHIVRRLDVLTTT
jgi:hypothetical protein